MTDLEFLLQVLADGELHSTSEILAQSIEERGHGLTVHSRVSDLRCRGYKVDHLTVQGARRGHANVYRLVSSPLEEPSATPNGAGADGSSSGGRVKHRFVPVSVSAATLVGDGAVYRLVVRRAASGARAWVGGDTGLLQGRDLAVVAAAGSVSPPAFFVDAPGEQLSLEA